MNGIACDDVQDFVEFLGRVLQRSKAGRSVVEEVFGLRRRSVRSRESDYGMRLLLTVMVVP